MPDVSSLYPQPPQPQQNGMNALMGDPLHALSVIQQLQAGQLQIQQAKAQQAGGAAILSGLRPDGTFDPNAAVRSADPSVVGAAGAQFANDVISSKGNSAIADTNVVNLRNAKTIAATNEVGLETTRNNALGDYLVGFAGKKLTDADLPTIRATAVRLGGNPNVWGSIKDIPSATAAIKNATIARAGATSAIQPTPNGVNPDLSQRVTSGAEAARNPNRTTTASPQDAADQTAFNEDQTRSSQIMRGVVPLQQALPLIQKLSASDFGGASGDIAKLKGYLVQAGIMDANSSSLPTRQEVNKYLHQAISAIPASERSDQARNLAELSNPNLDLTQPANIDLTKNAIAVARMEAALPKIFGRKGYLENKSGYYQGSDVNAYKFDLMTPEERGQFQASLGGPDSPAYKKFKKSYLDAKKAEMITPQGTGQ